MAFGEMQDSSELRRKIRDLITSESAGEEMNPRSTGPKLFVQLDEFTHEHNEWQEHSRWVRFIETVEKHGESWSKPQVSSLSLNALLETRTAFERGIVLLDCKASNFYGVIAIVLGKLKSEALINGEAEFERVLEQLELPHISQLARARSNKRKKEYNKFNCLPSQRPTEQELGILMSISFMRKVPESSLAAVISTGQVAELRRPVLVFVRLKEARYLTGVTSIPLPAKFLLFYLQPQPLNNQNRQIGKCLGTLMSDEVFQLVACVARSSGDLVYAVDEFCDTVTMLPPCNWEASVAIEPPARLPDSRLAAYRTGKLLFGEDAIPVEEPEDEVELLRTGRIFGGLVSDVKKRFPLYWSDFRDALHPQIIASCVFLYFAALTPIVTFGGLLGHATHNYMASMECILAGALCGCIFHLFSGQPLNVLGPTGPMLVLEGIIFNFASTHGLVYLSFRCWIGYWTTLILLVVVALDMSSLVRYITRFTEEAFACLISTIFIYDAISKTIKLLEIVPVNRNPTIAFDWGTCKCYDPNIVDITYNQTAGMTYFETNSTSPWAELSRYQCRHHHGTLVGPDCHLMPYIPDVFFLSVLLFLGTYVISTSLHKFRESSYFSAKFRSTISDFGVFLAIVVMTLIDYLIGLETPKLNAPGEFTPTKSSSRGWFVDPMEGMTWWAIFFAALLGLVAAILIIMDQQITAVIINRKDNMMKKGAGYHLDMFLVSVLVLVTSMFGLPWYVASTVVAITHVTSLKKYSQCTAPGEKAQFIGVREQRVTGFIAHALIGMSVFFTPLLKRIPMPVLYGVFLYMGVSSLAGLQLVDRILIVFMPAKYQPALKYLRRVPGRRVNLFTIIQLFCLIVLWVIKKIKVISISFPLMVLAIAIIRKLMEWLFSEEELKLLDQSLKQNYPKKNKDEEATPTGSAESLSQDVSQMSKLLDKELPDAAETEKINNNFETA